MLDVVEKKYLAKDVFGVAQSDIKEEFRKAFVAKLAGIVDYKQGEEFFWSKSGFTTVTIEFVESISVVKVRHYNSHDKKRNMEYLYKDGHLQTVRHFNIDGSVRFEEEWSNG